jgi:hypothetical protein
MTSPPPAPATVRTSDELDGFPAICGAALAASIAADLGQRGHITYDDLYAEHTLTYRRSDDAVSRVTRADLDEIVCAAVLDHARAALDDVDVATRARARTTLRAVSTGAVGVVAYLRRIRQRVLDLLPEIGDDEHDAIRAALRAAAPTPPPPPSRDAAARARQRAERTAADRATVEQILRGWLQSLAPGAYDLPAVWAAWQAAVTRSEKLRASHPGVVALGRSRFYEVLGEVTTIRNGAGRRRWIHVPAATPALAA